MVLEKCDEKCLNTYWDIIADFGISKSEQWAQCDLFWNAKGDIFLESGDNLMSHLLSI